MHVRQRVFVAVSAIALLGGCLAESGLQDEFREATNTLERLLDEIGDLPEVRAAVERAMDTADEAEAALEDFREDPSAETRRALEDAAQNVEAARDRLDGLLAGVPQTVREALRDVIDALTRIRRDIEREL